MKLIGRGAFTKCYKVNNRVLLKSTCFIKECMSLGWFPNSSLFPKITKIGEGLYDMKYYQRIRSLKKSLIPQHYQYYQMLRKINFDCTDFYKTRENFDKIPNKYLKNIMHSALDACSNYGDDVCFEISPRNVAVTNNGRLILLDCFFIRSQLKEKTK